MKPVGYAPRLKDLKHSLTLVDGTILKVFPQLAKASLLKQTTGSGLVKWRLPTHFAVDRHMPLRIDLREGSGKGPTDERCDF